MSSLAEFSCPRVTTALTSFLPQAPWGQRGQRGLPSPAICPLAPKSSISFFCKCCFLLVHSGVPQRLHPLHPYPEDNIFVIQIPYFQPPLAPSLFLTLALLSLEPCSVRLSTLNCSPLYSLRPKNSPPPGRLPGWIPLPLHFLFPLSSKTQGRSATFTLMCTPKGEPSLATQGCPQNKVVEKAAMEYSERLVQK